MQSLNSGWFAGPKAENAEWFARTLERVAWDYYFWRRNYFPEDGAVISAKLQREQEDFRATFDDLLIELLGRLKADCPFHSPRYMGHMLAEQTLPSIAGYFAAMLYNPNNVTSEAAPVTVELELEASRIIAHMLGHGPEGWAHLCSGGTMANFEALWVARSVMMLPYAITEAREILDIGPTTCIQTPRQAIEAYAELFKLAPEAEAREAMQLSRANISSRGWASVARAFDIEPIVIVPETHHYCFDKALDLLGLGRDAIRRVRVDSDFRMDVADLAARLEDAESRGESVMAVVAVMGSTEEGAIDPLDQILALRDHRVSQGKQGFWTHADGAYGGYLRSMMIPERIGLGEPTMETFIGGERHMLALDLPELHACDAFANLGECDSITIDPHKLGYVPYPAGAISFRDARIKPLLRQVAPYLQDGGMTFDEELQSNQIGMYSLEGSKPGAIAASVWLSHRCIPLDTSGHGKLMQETIRNASKLHALLGREWSSTCQAVPLCIPGSNIVCYALKPRRPASLQEINTLNRSLYARLSIRESHEANVYAQKFFVSRTTLAPNQYRPDTVAPFLEKLGVTVDEYTREGVFLLRSVLMNPWYASSLEKGDDVLVRMVEHLHQLADDWLLKQVGT